MKRNAFTLLAAATAAVLLLSACGGGSPGAVMSNMKEGYAVSSSAAAMPADTPSAVAQSGGGFYKREQAAQETAISVAMDDMGDMGEMEDGPVPVPNETAPLESRKIIKHSNLSLETLEFDQSLQQISALIEEKGGYIESQSIDSYGNSYHRSGEYVQERSASIQARIPSEKLDQTISEVGGICNLLSKSESMEDISDQYFDSEARLSTLQLQEERLLEILSKADKLEDVITLEQALSNVRYEIERLTASLKRMDNQVTYSYLNLDLREVVKYNETVSAPRTFGEKLAASFRRGGQNLVDSTQGVILFAAECGPMLLLWAAVCGLIVLIAVRTARRSGKRRAGKTAPPPLYPSKPEETEKSE